MDAGFNFTAEYRQDIAGQEDKDGFNLSFNYIKKLNTSCGLWIWKNPKCHSNDTIKRNN